MSLNFAKTLTHWRQGIRIYIALAIVLVTLESWWWASLSYGATLLFATRLEEIYAWLSLGLLITALAIGPTYRICTNLAGRSLMYDARRLLGVGAAWFASLHVAIAYVALFKAANPLTLPKNYQQSFIFGVMGLVILLAMAFTSFDRAFNRLGPWWFRLHRLVYLAVVFSLFHAFIIGTHAIDFKVLAILLGLAVIIFAMHAYLAFVRPDQPSIWQLLAVSGMFLSLLAVINYGYTQQLGYNPIEGKHAHVSK